MDTARMSGDSPLAHPDSPRSGVANRLQHLAIRQPQSPPPPPSSSSSEAAYEVPSSSQSPRKKLKRNPHIRDLRGDVQSRELLKTPPPQSLEIPDSVSGNSTLLLEVQETPDVYARLPSTPHTRGDGADSWSQAVDVVMAEPEHHQSSTRNPKRMMSPPPPSPPVGEKSFRSADAVDPFMPSSTRPTVDGDTIFDLSSLTWRDEEITGHLLNSPDDDGEGINGIGFRPTAAMAHARSQRRRQQVESWRAREAREARQRRLDRRRKSSRSRGASGGTLDGASDDVAGQDGNGRRTVRFAA